MRVRKPNTRARTRIFIKKNIIIIIRIIIRSGHITTIRIGPKFAGQSISGLKFGRKIFNKVVNYHHYLLGVGPRDPPCIVILKDLTFKPQAISSYSVVEIPAV